MDITTASVLFVVFMVGIYFNYRIGYSDGVEGGHQFGVYETVSWLVAKGYISGTNEDTGMTVSVKELTGKVLQELEERRPSIKEEIAN
jgi:hypothetical protein